MRHEPLEKDHLESMVHLHNQPELIAANVEDRVCPAPDRYPIGVRISLSHIL